MGYSDIVLLIVLWGRPLNGHTLQKLVQRMFPPCFTVFVFVIHLMIRLQ